MLATESIFWLSVLVVLYIYLGYPALLWLMASLSPERKSEQGHTPFVSVLIAACNEEAGIENKLYQTLRLEYPADKIEILVLSDGSEDRTDEIVRNFPDRRVRLVRIPQRSGKTAAQNEGVKQAKGEVLVFSDATTVYHRHAIQHLTSNYVDPRIGSVSGRYLYFDPRQISPTGLGTIAFWNYENMIKLWQSRAGTLTGCCGCIYSVRTTAYSELAPDIISDLVQPLRVIEKGYRVKFEEHALAYEQTTESTRDEFQMRVRVIARGMRGLMSVPELLKPWKHPWISLQLFSHKILRWMVPVFLFLLLLSNALLIHQPFLRLLFILQFCFYALALFQLVVPIHRRWRPLGIPLYFCTLNAAAVLGAIELLRGKKYVVWQPLRSHG